MIATLVVFGDSLRVLELEEWPPTRADVVVALDALRLGTRGERRASAIWLDAAGRAVVARVHLRGSNRRLVLRFERLDDLSKKP